MMQARTRAVEKHDVMRLPLALQEHAAQVECACWCDIFAQAKTLPPCRTRSLCGRPASGSGSGRAAAPSRRVTREFRDHGVASPA